MVEIIFETGNGNGQVFECRDFDFPKSKEGAGLGTARLPDALVSEPPIEKQVLQFFKGNFPWRSALKSGHPGQTCRVEGGVVFKAFN